nr:transposase and inactivated derivatives, IS5 family [Bradyrhizobium sp. DOA9]
MLSVIGGSSNQVGCCNPNLTDESSVTTRRAARPLRRYLGAHVRAVLLYRATPPLGTRSDQGAQPSGAEARVKLRQFYLRIAKTAATMAGRYAHAKQFRRHQRQLRILRSRLGRIIRDIRRKIEGQPALENAFALALSRASQIRSQLQRQRGWKLYSFHAPEVECIGKDKAAAPYEFGVKASIVTNNRRAPGGLFVLHARAPPDNPLTVTPFGTSSTAPRHTPAVRSSGPISTRDTAAMTRTILVASSSPARSAAFRCHQARAAPPLRHRTHHRTPEDRWSPRSHTPTPMQRSIRSACPRRRRPP